MRNFNIGALALLLAPAVLVAGCKSNDIADRKRPDEFAVGKQAPLVIPPDYALVPPAPGAAVVAGQTVQSQTLEALFGGPQQRSQVGGPGGFALAGDAPGEIARQVAPLHRSAGGHRRLSVPVSRVGACSPPSPSAATVRYATWCCHCAG